MLGFAEEVRLVGRHRVDQGIGLGVEAALMEKVEAIVGKRLHPQRHNPPPQPGLQHRFLRERHLDSALVLDALRQALEVALAQVIHCCCSLWAARRGVPAPGSFRMLSCQRCAHAAKAGF